MQKMDALTAQHDGTYALTFKNFKNITDEEIESIFSSYGNVSSIRKSSDQTPWVFVRYKQLDEALSAFNGLQGRNDFEIRVATSGRKNQEQGGSDRNSQVDSKDKGKMKGNRIRNNFMDRSCNGDDDMEPVTSSSQRFSHNRRGNNFIDKSPKEEYFSDEEDEVEEVGNSFQKISLLGHKKNMKVDREEAGNFRGNCSSPPKVCRKPVKSVVTGGARPRMNHLDDDDGPPKLIRAAEYYGAVAQKIPFENGLACRAAFSEVWANHPLREEIELKEVILTNFKRVPSKREVYEICEGVKLLHVSINVTPEKIEPFCRVLVATEDDANKLYELHGMLYNGAPMVVSSLEYILEEYLG